MKIPYNARTRQLGFSLLEVLVAFAILAISMGVILQSYSTGVRGIALSEEYTKAVDLAESQLAQVGVTIPLEVGVSEGDFAEKYHWSVSINSADDLVPAESTLLPLEVEIRVSWQDGREQRSVDLATLKLTRRPL